MSLAFCFFFDHNFFKEKKLTWKENKNAVLKRKHI